MKKEFWYVFLIAILLPCYLLAGCSTKTRYSSIESTREQATEYTSEERYEVDSSEISSLDVTQTPFHFEPEPSKKIDFRYIYRGFTAVPQNDREIIEKFMKFGGQTIATEEEWSSFMAFYCPGIPYEEPWDFSEDYLIASITGDASLACTSANIITSLVWEDGHFTPEHENDLGDDVYALNSEEYTHFYVEVVAVSRDIYSRIGENNQNAAPEEPASKPSFKTVFRGFTMVSLDDRERFERFTGFGTKVISTEENWNAFVSVFCPGMPSCESLDFTKDHFVVSIMMGARPTYTGTSRIVGIDQKTGFPVFENPLTNGVYALNTENHTHFYVEVIEVPSEQIPYNINTWTN